MRMWFALGALLLAAVPVYAEGVLGVAPLRLILGDKNTSDVLTLTNRADKTRTYKLVMQDQVMQASGSIVAQDDFAYSAKRMLRFMPRQVTLAAGQRQNIRVMALAPEGLPEGDYHTHLIFEQVKETETDGAVPGKGFKVELSNLYSVGIPVVVQHGATTGDLKLVGAKTFMQGEKKLVNVTLARSGNSEASAMVKIVDKATGASLSSPRNTHVYREVDMVTFVMPLKAEAAQMQVVLEREGKDPEVVDITH